MERGFNMWDLIRGLWGRKEEEKEVSTVEPVKEEPKTYQVGIRFLTLTDESIMAIVEYKDHPEMTVSTFIRYSGAWHYFNGDCRFTTWGRPGPNVEMINQKRLENGYQEFLSIQKRP